MAKPRCRPSRSTISAMILVAGFVLSTFRRDLSTIHVLDRDFLLYTSDGRSRDSLYHDESNRSMSHTTALRITNQYDKGTHPTHNTETSIHHSNASLRQLRIFPTTHFTHHTSHLANRFDSHDKKNVCSIKCHVCVDKPFSVPVLINCTDIWLGRYWKVMLEFVFSSLIPPSSSAHAMNLDQPLSTRTSNQTLSSNSYRRIIPGNVSIGFSSGDWADPRRHGYGCFGSSGPGGSDAFSVTNFEEMKRLARMIQAQQEQNVPHTGHAGDTYPILPWESRSKIPVFRGSPRFSFTPKDYANRNKTNMTVLEQIIEKEKPRARIKAVLWSKNHPTLLDAKLAPANGVYKTVLWKENATNGLNALLPLHSIPSDEYYTRYQVALVLGGIGAAFRFALHLSTGTAVVYQQFHREEWFIPYMTPFVNYIPLPEDLSNISETMEWIQDHPDEVRAIGEEGRQFYVDYLSLEATKEHVYELLYRLALKEKQKDVDMPNASKTE